MTIKTITASESIEVLQPNGLKKWKKTEWMAEIQEYEDAETQTLMLHQKVEATNLKAVNLSSPSWDRHEEPIAVKTEEVQVDRRIGVLAGDILSSPDIKTLESYKLLIKANPDLQTAYNQRLKELS